MTLVENGKEITIKAYLGFNGNRKIQQIRLENLSPDGNKGMHPFELATFGDVDL